MGLSQKLPEPMLSEATSIELRARESYHVLKIISEFVESGEKLQAIQPAVSIFGSARTKPDDPMYQKCELIARLLSDGGFSVLSGGGPGMMEAANKGAFEGISPSVGLNIVLPHEQKPNEFQDLSIKFNHFFPRKVMFVKHAIAFVGMPGGMGTLDELFESLTLVQTHKIKPRPIILCGSEFWGGLVAWMADKLVSEKVISPDDMDLIQIVDDPEEIVRIIFQHYETSGMNQNELTYQEQWSL